MAHIVGLDVVGQRDLHELTHAFAVPPVGDGQAMLPGDPQRIAEVVAAAGAIPHLQGRVGRHQQALLGLEIEGVEDPSAALGGFRICRVIEAVQHPNADRLRLCRVETWPEGPDGPTEEVQVVCGAPNARTGLVGVFASSGIITKKSPAGNRQLT